MLSNILRTTTFLGAFFLSLVLGPVRTALAADPKGYAGVSEECRAPETITDPDEDKYCKSSKEFTVNIGGKLMAIPYEVVNGHAIVEGDIDLGPVEEIQKGGAGFAPVVPPKVGGE